ncbi:MAG: hypothetical protein ABSD59_22990 [Terracidiphilus sp.]
MRAEVLAEIHVYSAVASAEKNAEDVLRSAWTRKAKRPDPKQWIEVITEDRTDNRILECAAASASRYIVSGDNYLLTIGPCGVTKIVKAADFLEIVTQHGRGDDSGSLGLPEPTPMMFANASGLR